VIHAFIGSSVVDGDVKWHTSRHHAGKLSIFARARDALCLNCKTKQPQRGSIDITDALLKGIWFPKVDDTPDEIKKHLQLKLFIRQAGKEIPLARTGISMPEVQLWSTDTDTDTKTPDTDSAKPTAAVSAEEDVLDPKDAPGAALTLHELSGVVVPRHHPQRKLVKTWTL